MEELYIDFYRGKDEEAFLTRYKDKIGSLTEDEIDELFAKIADQIDQDVKTEEHELGDEYYYQGVRVGRSDFNEKHNLYLFED